MLECSPTKEGADSDNKAVVSDGRQLSFFTQSNSVRAVLETFLALFSALVRQKVNVSENIRIIDRAFGTRVPDCSKSAINQKIINDLIIYPHDLPSNFLNVDVFVQVSCQHHYWFWSCVSFGLYGI